MSIKKRIFTLLVTITALALLVTGISLTAFAEDGEVPEGVAFKLEHADGTAEWYYPDSDATLSDLTRAGETFSNLVSSEVTTGDKIVAYTDFDIPKDLTLNKNITIDLDGHTVTTTGRIFVDEGYTLSVLNGTVSVTDSEFIYMGEWVGSSSTSDKYSVELKNIHFNNASSTSGMYALEIRAGSLTLDNITVNENDWTFATSSSSSSFISAGYKARLANQPINVTVKSSNINVVGGSFINATGASGQADGMGGYMLNLTIDGSSVTSTHYTARVNPSDEVAALCGVNMYVTGDSVLYSSNPIYVSSAMSAENVAVKMDYGVTTKKPKPAVGTVTLGEDGNGVLDLISSTDSSNTGVIRDLWVDEHTPATDYAYTLVAVGDTQNTVNYDASNLHYIYDWIIENKDTQNIQFVFGMGDITNHSLDTEWPIAWEQIARLNGVVPYSLVRGNHDTSESFNEYINNEAYKSMFEGFYDEQKAENAYVTFTVGETEFLHITLDYRPSNEILYWAASVIEQYPEHKVILSTHSYLNYDGTLSTEGASVSGDTNSGEQIWTKLASQYENVFLVLSGHVFATDLACSQMEGVNGNTVTQIMTNGQCHDFKNGAMGLISLLHFSEDGKTIQVEYYSTVYGRYFGDNSQFTLTVPDYVPVDPDTVNYLYEVTDAKGNVRKFSDAQTLSYVLSAVTDGCTVKLLGDVTVSSATAVSANVTLDLNGHTISTDGGRLSGNCEISIKNGTVKIISKELIYVNEGYTEAKVTLTDIEVINESTSSVLAEIRDGSLTLDNVRISSDNWNSSKQIMTIGSRTKVVGCEIPVALKNCAIDLGAKTIPIIYYGGNSGEVNGYTATISVIGSTLVTAGNVVKTNPTADGAKNSSAIISFDGSTVIKSATPFSFGNLPTDNINISFAEGASLSTVPSVSGVTISYAGDVFVYSNTDSLFKVASTESVNTALVACKLVDENGRVVCYWEGNELNQELLTHAQEAGCDIVLVGDMTTPTGTSASRYAMTVTQRELTIDLDGHTLNVGNFSYFGTVESESKMLTVKNGSIKHQYTIFYSYKCPDDGGFTAINVKFTITGTYSAFDHREGQLKLVECEVSNTNTTHTSEWSLFTLGNKTSGNQAVLSITGCTITANSQNLNVFKTYAGVPVSVTVEDSTISAAVNGKIISAVNTKSKAPADVFTFKSSTVYRTGQGELFNVNYDTVTISLDEVYVPTGSTYEIANGTVNLAKGQTKATVLDGGYMITAPKIKIQANLTLYVDFTMNLWLDENTAVTSITVDGVEYKITDADIVDGRYRFRVQSIVAGRAADDIAFTVTYTDDDKTLSVEKKYSIIRYAAAILESEEYSNEAKALLASVVNYVSTAYAYDEGEMPAELSSLLSSEAYTNALALEEYDAVETVPESKADIGTANNALSGVRLSLGSSVEFLFTVNPNYTGPITLTYSGKVTECYAVNGKVGENDYIKVEMRAFDIYDKVISIAAGEYSGTYDLSAYVLGIKKDYESDANLESLLLGLYNYCKEANEYNAYVKVSGELN